MLNIAQQQRNENESHNASHQSGWPSLQSLQRINAGEGVKKRETAKLFVGMGVGKTTVENNTEVL